MRNWTTPLELGYECFIFKNSEFKSIYSIYYINFKLLIVAIILLKKIHCGTLDNIFNCNDVGTVISCSAKKCFYFTGWNIQASTLTFVRYQWKLTSDKKILYHGCPTWQVKKWLSYLLKVIFYDKNVLLCHFYRHKLRK